MRAVGEPAARRVLVPQSIGGPPLPPFGTRAEVGLLEGRTMGTTWRTRVVVRDRVELASHRVAIEAALAGLIDDLSNWEPDSALSCFGRAPLGAWQSLPDSLIDVLVAAKAVHARSGGAFDPTVAAAVGRWGFGPQPRAGVAAPAVVLAACFDAIEVDVPGRRARRRADVGLDLCGIAKGYAVDRLSHLLTARGAPHHLIEIGGELRGNGVKPDGMPWWVALETPPDGSTTDDDATLAALHGLSIATSGDYRHYFEREGRRYAHTIDPATGRPVTDAAASVTVLHADCMRADAEATAIVVLGVDAGLAYANAQGLAARVIARTSRGLQVHDTSAFAAMLA